MAMAANKKLSKVVMTALFTAFICAGCFIQIPLPGGVPIVIQDMMAMLSGMILGPLYGGLSVLLFLVLGCAGLPVFSGKAGIPVILQGVTGGFLVGYLLGAIVGGLIMMLVREPVKTETEKKNQPQWFQWLVICVAAVAATVVVFICGIAEFMRITSSSFTKTLSLVLVPFIPGNAIKCVVMILLTKKFRPMVKNYL